jgi:hypothetical protein
MSYNPKVYNTVIQSGTSGAGTYNLAPIAYGLFSGNALSKSYNISSTITGTGNTLTMTIIHPTPNGNYIPIVTLTDLAYNDPVPIIDIASTTNDTIVFRFWRLRDSNNNQIVDTSSRYSFYVVIYGN